MLLLAAALLLAAGVAPSSDGARGHGPLLGPLRYNGGVVGTAAPRVFLVFWGAQWGRSTPHPGGATFANDPDGVAPILQRFYAGIGTGGEHWSSTLSEYCQGVAVGATACATPTGTPPATGPPAVGPPAAGPPAAGTCGCGEASTTVPVAARSVVAASPGSGVLAGVWADGRAAAPHAATIGQLATEATAAATHFGAPTGGGVQYVLVSPTGTLPLSFSAAKGDCGEHWSADVRTTEIPYVPDAGPSCGAYAVHGGSAGAVDGVTLTAGHEYAEVLTDPDGATGWLDDSQQEIADKCALAATNGAGFGDVHFATGTFPLQTLWSNAAQACVLHP